MIPLKQAIETSLIKSFSYHTLQEKMLAWVQENKSSSAIQSEDLAHYTKLNQARMKRLSKTQKIDELSLKTLATLNKKQTWLVITESWCGDAAQSVPIINKLAESNDLIDLKIVLRDDNIDLMNHFLTNGNTAIPKLIVLDTNNNVLANWGPRPTTATKMVNSYKKEHGGLDDTFKENLQIWYHKNKGLDILQDLNELVLDVLKNN